MSTINTRIKLKRDTESQWDAQNPTILNGEVVLVDSADGRLRAKIGGENTTYKELEFLDNIHVITEENKDEDVPANAVLVVNLLEDEELTLDLSGYMRNVAVTSDDKGKVLTVSSNGTWIASNASASSGGAAGNGDHALLDNLNLANQHPIAAIIGLQDALNHKIELVDGKIPIDYLSLSSIISGDITAPPTSQAVIDYVNFIIGGIENGSY